MKKKLLIINVFLLIAVSFSILFQSVHSYEHLVKQLSEKQCHHKYNHHKTEVSHSHHDYDNCFVCKYSFSNYISTEFFSFSFRNVVKHNSYSFAKTKNPVVFSGKQLALRGPPSFIV
jgi:hypothetical protein